MKTVKCRCGGSIVNGVHTAPACIGFLRLLNEITQNKGGVAVVDEAGKVEFHESMNIHTRRKGRKAT